MKRRKKNDAKGRTRSRSKRNAQQGPLAYFANTGVGLDYSLTPAVLVPGVDFHEALSSSKLSGVLYGVYQHSDLGPIPGAALICDDPIHGRRVGEIFKSWSESGDGDAISLTWIWEADRYRVAVAPEPSYLVQRTLGYQRYYTPLLSLLSYQHQLGAVSNAARQFRSYCDNWYKPFMFSLVTTTHSGFDEIFEPVVKFECTHLNEGPDQRQTFAEAFGASNCTYESPILRNDNGRLQTFALHFPVTLRRVSAHLADPQFRRILGTGVQQWQLQQSAINLVLSRELGSQRPHFADIPRAKLIDAVREKICERHESADSRSLHDVINPATLERQLCLDAGALLQAKNLHCPKDWVSALAALKTAGFC